MKHAMFALSALGVLLGGCASSLNVYGQDQREIVGIPFRAAEVYVKTGMRNRHTEHGESCTPAAFVQTVSLPTGAQYFVNVDPAQFATTGFEIEFNDAGGLSSVALNTEPSADAIDSVTGALSTLLPFVGVTADVGPQGPQPTGADLPACDAGEDRVRFVTLNEYLATQPSAD